MLPELLRLLLRPEGGMYPPGGMLLGWKGYMLGGTCRRQGWHKSCLVLRFIEAQYTLWTPRCVGKTNAETHLILRRHRIVLRHHARHACWQNLEAGLVPRWQSLHASRILQRRPARRAAWHERWGHHVCELLLIMRPSAAVASLLHLHLQLHLLLQHKCRRPQRQARHLLLVVPCKLGWAATAAALMAMLAAVDAERLR